MERIALIGLSGYGHQSDTAKLESYPWKRIGAIKNLADYDTVIIYLPTFNEWSSFHRPTFDEKFNLANFCDLMKGNGRLIIIGDPRFDLPADREPSTQVTGLKAQMASQNNNFLQWTLLGISFDGRFATMSNPIFDDHYDSNKFHRFIELTKQVDFSISSFNPDMKTFKAMTGWDDRLRRLPDNAVIAYLEPYSRTRYHTYVACEVRFALMERNPYSDSEDQFTRHVGNIGCVTFLPSPSTPADDSIRILLTDAFDIQMETTAPEWAELMLAPEQREIDAELDRVRNQLELLVNDQDRLLQKRKVARMPLALLYGRHRDLEASVKTVFEKLGASILDDPSPNARDIHFTVEIAGNLVEFVAEVKSKEKGSFDVMGLNQLLAWEDDALSEGRIPPKLVFVGNAHPDLTPQERPNPFGTGFQLKARKMGAVVLDTRTLYGAYELVLSDKMDRPVFWEKMARLEGIVEIDHFTTPNEPPQHP
jgi:hypothetical protein